MCQSSENGSKIFWLKNIKTETWTFTFDTRLNVLLILIDNSWWLFFWGPLNKAYLIYPIDPATNTTMGSVRSSALTWKGPLLILTSQECHLEPFQSSYRFQDQLCKQLFVSIKCMHCLATMTSNMLEARRRGQWTESLSSLWPKNPVFNSSSS